MADAIKYPVVLDRECAMPTIRDQSGKGIAVIVRGMYSDLQYGDVLAGNEIVHRLNAHDKLVAFAERVVESIVNHGDPFSGGDHDLLNDARATLAEAKGGKNG